MRHVIVKRMFGILAAGAIAGCSTSRWEAAYEGEKPAATSAAVAAQRVRITTISWDQLRAARREIASRIAAGPARPEEWAIDQKVDLERILLRGLGVDADPADIEILGRSEFRTAMPVSTDNGELAALASKVGATRVVWSSRAMKDEDPSPQRVEPPPGEDSSRIYSGRRRGTGFDYRADIKPGPDPADETAWIAYFLRDRR